MTREIKFRAWNKKLEKFANDWEWNDESGVLIPYNDDCVLMQYTGLKDKNGKEIYEGDIVQVFYHDQPQTEENKAYTVVIEDIREGFSGVGDGLGEIIGNIYENPELLTRN